jgi:peptidoglycan/xylan/chitin deacetylase (PgdA/CDA1 family)
MNQIRRPILFAGILICWFACNTNHELTESLIIDDHGAIVRMDTTKNNIYLVFTGHEFADGFDVIRETLAEHDIKAAFFFTGDFYRNPSFNKLINILKQDGHYLGAHSDKHLLYCTWEKRDSLLVSKAEFVKDLKDNYKEMARFGIKREEALFFMPPYEWYNLEISKWTEEMGLTLFNFTGGTSANQDWTYPELGKTYISSDSIFNRILNYEKTYGMNGFILLSHIGTDPRRTDKFYYKLDSMIGILKHKGYSFKGID